MTPMRLVQMYIELPIYGDNKRDPMISYTITTAPQKKTAMSRAIMPRRSFTIKKALLCYNKTGPDIADLKFSRSGYCCFFFTGVGNKGQPVSAVRCRLSGENDFEKFVLDHSSDLATLALADGDLIDRRYRSDLGSSPRKKLSAGQVIRLAL